MPNSFEVELQLQANDQTSLNRYKKIPKWISCYRPKVNLNSSEYHFVADPVMGKHQAVTVKNSQSSRPITMYFQIEDPKEFHEQYSVRNRKDESLLKSFQHINMTDAEEEIVISKEQAVKDSMWARKYQPKAFYELLSEEVHNRNVLTWLKSWDWIVFRKQVPTITPTVKFQKNLINTQLKPYQPVNEYDHTKLLLLSGPPGCGKTTLARVVARHCGYEVMELNASDDRSGKALIEKIEAMGKNNSVMNGKPTMIIVDEVDGALEQDGNGIKEVLAYIQTGGKQSKTQKTQQNKQNNSRFPRPNDLPKTQNPHNQKHTAIQRPIIFICNDPFVKGLKQLRSKAIVVYFRQVQKDRIVKRLKQITEKENVYVESDVLNKIAEITNCDVRGSLGILQYICNAKRTHNHDPKGKFLSQSIELITKLRISFQKDSTTSINEFISSLLNQTRSSSLKTLPNLRQFSYNFSKIDNQSLLFEMFYHNFSLYKNFFVKRTKETLKLYNYLKWSDELTVQSFRCGGETDVYLMILFFYYKTHIVNDERRKIEFPSGFFERLNRTKQNKEIIHQLVEKWPAFLKSTVSNLNVIKEYIWILYFAVQTGSNKDSEIIDCVGKMITYNIELAPRNSPHLFKPEFQTLLTYPNRPLQTLYTATSRSFIQQSYEFAKLKSHLLTDMSLADLNKNTEELLSQLNIRNRKRKRNPQSMGKNTIKYKFIEGSGTQIAYDLKFKYFFQ